MICYLLLGPFIPQFVFLPLVLAKTSGFFPTNSTVWIEEGILFSHVIFVLCFRIEIFTRPIKPLLILEMALFKVLYLTVGI